MRDRYHISIRLHDCVLDSFVEFIDERGLLDHFIELTDFSGVNNHYREAEIVTNGVMKDRLLNEVNRFQGAVYSCTPFGVSSRFIGSLI